MDLQKKTKKIISCLQDSMQKKGTSQSSLWCSQNEQSLKNHYKKWWRTHLPMQETWVRSLGQEDPLEKEMVTHSSILAWENPMDRGAWPAYSPLDCEESDTTERPNNSIKSQEKEYY